MTNVDQFESMFRSASREVFQHERVNIESILVVTDRDEKNARLFGDQIRQFLAFINADEKVHWRDVNGSEFQTAGELLELVDTAKPDLICTYRNLHSSAWKWPYSLGTHVDLLTQHTGIPVMLLPHPDAKQSTKPKPTEPQSTEPQSTGPRSTGPQSENRRIENSDKVMAIADHITGDHRLVNYAAQFTENGGTLWLTHIEDQSTFDRYIDVISKIPSIDTDEAREAVRGQLLKEPQDYIDGCIEVLQKSVAHARVEHLVTFGQHLPEYKRLIEQHEIDLLVMNTKDEDQLAMRGIAYALAVELRHIPLLML